MSWWLLLSRPPGEKREETAQKQFLSRPSAQQGEICLSRRIWAIWIPDPCCLMNLTYIKHPQHHPHGATPPDHHYAHPQHHFHSENHLWSPAQRTPHLKAGRDTSLNQASSNPAMLTEDTHGLSALLAETSPLAPYRIQWQAKVKAQKKISTQKWLLSRPP